MMMVQFHRLDLNRQSYLLVMCTVSNMVQGMGMRVRMKKWMKARMNYNYIKQVVALTILKL